MGSYQSTITTTVLPGTNDNPVKIIHTDLTDPFTLRGFERDQVYNGLDVCVTHEILPRMLAQLDPLTSRTYQFERDLQGPVLEMRLRGCLVDQSRRAEVIDQFWETLDQLEADLNRIVLDGVGLTEFNWRSPAHLRKLFYSELGLPTVRRGGKVTIDDDAREGLSTYPIATQIVAYINAMTDLGKKISVLRTEIDPDGRIRTSYGIAGTSTGRFSSSISEFGTGGNLQNIEESPRAISLLNSTVSPANPGSSAPSNGTSSATAATSTCVNLATLTQQLLSLCGLDLGGPVIITLIEVSPSGRSIDITLTASCARRSDTAQTSEANHQQSPSRPSSP